MHPYAHPHVRQLGGDVGEQVELDHVNTKSVVYNTTRHYKSGPILRPICWQFARPGKAKSKVPAAVGAANKLSFRIASLLNAPKSPILECKLLSGIESAHRNAMAILIDAHAPLYQ